ncbi:peptide-methionine (S)-S-oxide reductase MsrA [Saccharibacillus sp. O23]|uniref:peptide-methionine (S)-S-oxide reductase MsrA n=1 Tax=Saccharibacillus sp. O23 TaxID=2009338 RepID=UPI001C5301D7|nr:peptide-methionine (S)-S-oxide reductase MsrA [Saccharibacillus sp. O23]
MKRVRWMIGLFAVASIFLVYAALSTNGEAQSRPDPDSPAAFANPNADVDYSQADLRTIDLAGGCFWGVEAYLSRLYGVADVTVGYAYGAAEGSEDESGSDPLDSAKSVSSELSADFSETPPNAPDVPPSGYAETVRVTYDPARLPLSELLGDFFRVIDPTSLNRQGEDIGTQYRSGVYYTDQADLPVIEAALRREQTKYNQPIVTETLPLARFVIAAESQQDYLEKNPNGYCSIDLHALDNS